MEGIRSKKRKNAERKKEFRGKGGVEKKSLLGLNWSG